MKFRCFRATSRWTHKAAVLLLLLAVIGMSGCKEDAAPFETIDALSVLSRADLHGQLGHLIQIQSAPAKGGQGSATTVYAKVFDKDISDAPYYLQWKHTAAASDYLSTIATVLSKAEALALVNELPQGVSFHEEVVIGKPNTTADRVTHCLEVTTEDGVFYVGVHIVFTSQVKAWLVNKLSQPLRILLLEEKEGELPILPPSVLPEAVRTTITQDDDGTSVVSLQKDTVPVNPRTGKDTLTLAAYSKEVLELEPETPAQVVAITYYLDEALTHPLTNEVMIGDTVYSKVVFSKDVPVVLANDSRARPRISFTTAPQTFTTAPQAFQYRMKPRGTMLGNGDAQPYQGSRVFVALYRVPGLDFRGRFFTSAGHPPVHGNTLQVKAYQYDPDEDIPSNTGVTITDWQPDDFVGQVYTVPPRPGTADRSRSVPIPGVTVTIMAGPRTGERIVTDRNGRYRFLNIPSDSLHLHTYRPRFEPKEAIVYRTQPTTLSDGSRMNYWRDPQQQPGNILIGQVWPDEVRFILEETLLPYDLLYIEYGTSDYSIGFYGSGFVVLFSDSMRGPSYFLPTLAHELMHAHQHAIAAIDGSAGPLEIDPLWLSSPEGKAYAAAREKDWAEFGKASYDHLSYYRDDLTESSAEIAAYYWGTDRWEPGPRLRDLEKKAPNRLQWAAEWLPKK